MKIRALFVVLSISYIHDTLCDHEVKRWLESPRITNWGSWGQEELCPPD